MSQKVIYQKRLAPKILVFAAIAAVLGVGLFYYMRMQRFLHNFEYSYLTDLYVPLYARELNDMAVHAYGAAAFTLGLQKTNTETASGQPAEEARSVPVLVYHGVASTANDSDTSVVKFREQMTILKQAGYNAISIYDFVDYIKGRKKLPQKSFLLTFDDGRKDSYYPVDPVLKALDFHAVIYVITGHSLYENKKYYYLDRNELQEMKQSGRWDIQSHAYQSHGTIKISQDGSEGPFFGNKMWLDDQKRLETDDEYRMRISGDMIHAKDDIKNILGVKVVSFAFPFNNFAQNQTNFPDGEHVLLEESSRIFDIAFAQSSQADLKQNSPGVSDFLMRRIEVRPQWSADELLSILEATGEKTPFYSDKFDTNNGWQAYWGLAEVKDHALDVVPSTGDVSGAAVLEGTATWGNYRAVAIAELVRGSTMSIMARYRTGNYVSCTYSIDGRIRLEQSINGQTFPVAVREPQQRFQQGIQMHIGIYADGARAGCLLDDQIQVSGLIDSSRLPSGGIGFKTWDEAPEASHMRISEVRIEEITHTAVNPSGAK